MSKALLIMAAFLAVLLINAAFAWMGEPRAEWLVCEALNIDMCKGDL